MLGFLKWSVILFLGLFFVAAIFGDSSSSSNNSYGSSYSSAKIIKSGGWTGCKDKDFVKKIYRYAGQRDEKAYGDLILGGVLAGVCTVFKKGEVVYRMDQSLGYTKVRRKGEVAEYWTLTEVFDD